MIARSMTTMRLSKAQTEHWENDVETFRGDIRAILSSQARVTGKYSVEVYSYNGITLDAWDAERREWYEDYEMLVAFARVLVDSGRLPESKDVIWFLEKPWKWTTECMTWLEMGRPETLGDIDASECVTDGQGASSVR